MCFINLLPELPFIQLLYLAMCIKSYGFPGGAVVKTSPAKERATQETGSVSGSGRRGPRPGFLPGELHGQRSLAGPSPWDQKELDATECTYARTHTHMHTHMHTHSHTHKYMRTHMHRYTHRHTHMHACTHTHTHTHTHKRL